MPSSTKRWDTEGAASAAVSGNGMGPTPSMSPGGVATEVQAWRQGAGMDTRCHLPPVEGVSLHARWGSCFRRGPTDYDASRPGTTVATRTVGTSSAATFRLRNRADP